MLFIYLKSKKIDWSQSLQSVSLNALFSQFSTSLGCNSSPLINDEHLTLLANRPSEIQWTLLLEREDFITTKS